MEANVQKRENRRVRYTRMALRESLLALLQQYPISRITVSRICEQADVNRSTFYLYYQDAFDLLRQIEDELYGSSTRPSRSLTAMPSVEILRRSMVIYKPRPRRVLFRVRDKDFLKISSVQRSDDRRPETTFPRHRRRPAGLFAYSSYTNIGIIRRWISTILRDARPAGAHDHTAAPQRHLLLPAKDLKIPYRRACRTMPGRADARAVFLLT